MFAAFRLYLLAILAAASLLGAGSCAAIAADASPWDDHMQSAARLIAARAHNESGGRVFRAGVEIKLKEGWKTYWRYPGDSGVPPALDFSRSQNVKAVTVLYPAPMRFPDGAGGTSIGYKDVVILPWYFEKRAESLQWFEKRGHRQIIAGYYDHRPEQVLQWLEAAKSARGLTGVMYTTWQNKYGLLADFGNLVSK